MNYLQRSTFYAALFFCFLFIGIGAMAQSKTISGQVKSATDSMPVSDVSVQIKGSTAGTSTDAEGRFTLTTVTDKSILIFSHTGYKEIQIPVRNQTVIHVAMELDSKAMEEIVVTGYRAQSRGTVLGSVSSVTSAELANAPVDNLSNALAGRLSGATISQAAGTPGQESNIRVRSVGTFNNSNPLYVIDGIVSDKFAFDGLSPSEVESVTILKDGASAAIYGSRAANGVILVTTKRGREGAAKLNYAGLYGIQKPTQIPETLSAYEQATLINNGLRYTNVNPNDIGYFTQDELDYFKDHSWNWVDEMWKNPQTTQHTLDVSGGARNIKYFLGGSYNYATGSFNNIDFQKINLRANIDVAVTNNLKLAVDINTDDRATNGPSWDVNNWRMEDLYKALMFRSKMVPPYVNGLPVGNTVEWHPGVVLTPALSGYNKRKWTDLNSTVTLNYNVPFIKGLSAKTSINRYKRNIYNKQFNLPYNMTQFNTTGTHNHIVGDQVVGPKRRDAVEFLLSRNDQILRYQFNVQLNYKRNFGLHNIDALLVYEQAEEDTVWFNGRRDDFISNNIDQYIAGSTVNATVDGRETKNARISYVGLLSYNYAQKYLLETSFRYDGSVIFPPGNRWGFFPSASAGWRISDEPFFRPVNFINDLKLRASVGLLGNDNVGMFQYLKSYNIVYGAIFNNQTSGLQPGILPNRNITWEKSLNYNAGFDTRFWKNNMSFKFDMFYRHGYDILGTRQLSIPSTLGAALPDENYQQIDSRGFEIELGYNGQAGSSNNPISYYVRGNFSYATSKIIQVDEAQNIRPYQSAIGRPVGLQANGTTINRNGNAANDQLFGLVAVGILRTQADLDALPANYTIMGAKPQLGMLNYQDIRGTTDDKPDGKITNDDREYLAKYSIPPMNFGLSLGGSWKSLSIDVLFQGVAGAKAMLPTAGRDIQARVEESSFRYWADSWSPDNPDGKYPGYWLAGTYRTRYDASSFFLVDNSFVRLKNLTVSWTLPQKMLSRAGIKNSRIFFTGTNLLLLYNGNDLYDPEVNNILSYPNMKAFSFGLNLGL